VTAIDRAHRLPALRACASGIRPLEAGTSVLIGCGCWRHREDFTSRFIITGTSVSDGTADGQHRLGSHDHRPRRGSAVMR
jgi:hypothetical protein